MQEYVTLSLARPSFMMLFGPSAPTLGHCSRHLVAQSVAFVVHQLLKAHLDEPARNPLEPAWNLR